MHHQTKGNILMMMVLVHTPVKCKVWECMSEILDDFGECSDDSVGTSGMELNSYLREPLIRFQKGNPYVWWNKNQRRYPL